MDELVDHSLVARFHRAQRLFRRVLDFDELRLIRPVCRGRHHVELRGIRRVFAGEQHFLRPLRDVQAVLVAQLVLYSVRRDAARAADVEDADLPALQKILRAEVVPDVDALVDGHRLCSGHAPQRHHSVHMAVHRHHFVCRIQVLDQKLFARLLCCIALEVPLVA